MSALSPHATKIGELFHSLNQNKGDFSTRMEGMCQVVSAVIHLLTTDDRKHVAKEIMHACHEFGQVAKISGAPTNRFAIQTLKDLE